jgi:Methylase involved in ubiquinone/menaquinone biosynthesis
MSFKEPSSTQIFFTVAVGHTFGSFFWRNYVKSLNLKGSEKILEYGSGSGALSRHIAPILLKGGGQLTCVDISQKWMNTIQKRMDKYPNVEFKLGTIFDMDIPDNSYDAVVIHYVLHDIEHDLRKEIVNVLSKKLKDGGKLYIREPLADNHGMPSAEIRGLMIKTGLNEIDFKINNARLVGESTEAVFEK